jgi:hypothetical protein
MSLSVAKSKLEKSILDAFEKALQTGKKAGDVDNSEKIRKDLSIDLANAIHQYVISADVNLSTVTSIVPPGVTVSAPPPSGAGVTISPGKSEHTGYGKLQ